MKTYNELEMDKIFQEEKALVDNLVSASAIKSENRSILQKQDEIVQLRKLQGPLFIMFSLLALSAIAFFYYNRMIRRDNLKISEQHARISELYLSLEKQLQENNMMFKEMHHRVKNNLTMLTGIFHYQKKRIEDAEARQVLADTNARSASMAMIHELVYARIDPGRLSVGTYLEQLGMHIADMHYAPYRVGVQVICNPRIEAGQKVLYPLGIMINELMLNAFRNSRDFYDQKIDSASQYIDHGSYNEALELMARITPRSDSLRALSYPQLLKIYILNGRLYKLVFQLDKAMSCLLKAKRLAGDFGIKKDMAEVNIQLAELQRVMREPAKANEILRETRSLLEVVPENYSLLALMYNRQASVAVTRDSVEYLSLKSLDYARKANDKNLVATSLNELGYLYVVKGFDTAMSYYRQSVELWRETGNRHEELNTLINIAYTYYGNQKHTLSLMTLDTIRRILCVGYLRYIEHMRTFLISMNYQKLGKYDSAFFYLNKHYENFFRDAKGDQYRKAKQFEFAEEMANRKYQAEQPERELALTKSMNVYIILTVLLLFFFGLFLFFSNRKLRKKNAEINGRQYLQSLGHHVLNLQQKTNRAELSDPHLNKAIVGRLPHRNKQGLQRHFHL